MQIHHREVELPKYAGDIKSSVFFFLKSNSVPSEASCWAAEEGCRKTHDDVDYIHFTWMVDWHKEALVLLPTI